MDNIAIFLVEGEDLDVRMLKEIKRHFFADTEINIIAFRTNIYSLYKQMKKDEFETDLISVLQEKNTGKDILTGTIFLDQLKDREQVSEIYLFFDYDAHHYKQREHLEEIVNTQLSEMLNFFDNETEQGKLYLSYPMIEAIHHFSFSDVRNGLFAPKIFSAYTGKDTHGIHYKVLSRQNNRETVLYKGQKYQGDIWELILTNYLWNFSYLFVHDHFLTYELYLGLSNSSSIYSQQLIRFIDKNQKLLVFSGYPQFLLDYFGDSLYSTLIVKENFYLRISVEDIS